jgi:hypothetical protein
MTKSDDPPRQLPTSAPSSIVPEKNELLHPTPAPDKLALSLSSTHLTKFHIRTKAMADEREPLLSYHEVQAARTEQLLAHEITASAQANKDYPVDHGKVAWMQVLGGFVLFANTW